MASTIQIKRGTGSAVPTGLADGELAINLDNRKLYFGSSSNSVNTFRFENLIAENYIVSSSVTNITTQELSGSTVFGNSQDDKHKFTGNITASNNISASGTMQVSDSGYFIGTQVPPALSIESTRLRISSSNDIFYDSGDDHIFMSEGAEIVHIRGDEAILEVTGDLDVSGEIEYIVGDNNVNFGVDGNSAVDLELYGHSHTYTAGSNITLDAGGNIALDAAGDNIYFKDAGTTNADLNTNTGKFTTIGDISSSGVVSGDTIFVGTAGSAAGHISSSGNKLTGFEQSDGSRKVWQLSGTTTGGSISVYNTDSEQIRLSPLLGTYFDSNQTGVSIGTTTSAEPDCLLLAGAGHITASGNISSSGNITGLTGSFNILEGLGGGSGLEVTGSVSAHTGSFDVMTKSMQIIPWYYYLSGTQTTEKHIPFNSSVDASNGQYYNQKRINSR